MTEPSENAEVDILRLQQEVAQDYHETEASFRKNHPIRWLSSLLGPFVLTATVLTVIYFLHGKEFVFSIVGQAVVTFVFLGRFVILLGQQGAAENAIDYLTPLQLCTMVTFMDFMTAFFVAFHMGIMFRIPLVGPKISELVSDGRFILTQFPNIRRWAFVGLVLFVIFPTSTTGSIGGSIFGRLLGLKKWTTVTAILIGSVIGNGIMFVFAEQINEHFPALRDNIWLKLGGVGALVLVFLIFERKYKTLRQEYFAKLSENQTSTDSDSNQDSAENQNA